MPVDFRITIPTSRVFPEEISFFLKKELEVSEKIVILQMLMILAREGSPKRD